ncbi:RagB/SusD family nutrient uptake outer membrane protein [Parapedobacter pyrenivorans]|nr:RagB/SusD family nutrient uptake outer membrane protein [Parapedobacter pyrenivorans]
MKTYKPFFICCLLLTTMSCTKDLLNTIPKDRLASELFWKTQEDAVFAANGIYSILGNQWRYASMDAFTDLGHFILQWRSESEVEKHTFDASNNVIASEWSYYYSIVRAANNFLENVDLVTEMDEELRNRLKAEAKVLRSFSYINLVMLYGPVPLVTTSLNVEEAKSVTRTPENEIWDFVASELTSAAADLPAIQEERGRVTSGAALGLKARAMLYAGRYSEARSAAKAVMELGVHAIDDSYKGLFDYAGENSSEVIFARQQAKNIQQHAMFAFFTANSLFSQQCQVVPTKSLVDAYLMKSTGLPIDDPTSGFDQANPYLDRDPRLYHTVYLNGDMLANGKTLNTLPGSGTGDDITISAENVTSTGWYFKKYVSEADFGDPWNCGVNLIYLRYAEVLLTYAEASIELGEIDQSVLNALNEIRGRKDVAMPEVTITDQGALRQLVRRERMVELAMEGHRLFDIRRWDIGENAIRGTVKGMTYKNSNGNYTTVELTGYVKEFDTEKHYLWPIPFRELNLNKGLTQNPGF